MSEKQLMLIVDDMEINREMLSSMFDKGFDILQATNGREALARLEEHGDKVAIVLLDLIMPEMGGLEVLSRMRHNEQMTAIPTVVITGEDNTDTLTRAFELGAWDVLNKPFNARLIERRISNIASMRQAMWLATEESRLKELQDKLEHDPLTGLLSREAFFSRTEAMLRYSLPGSYAMVAFDIDGFKIINDQYGTENGDRTLQYIADMFSKRVDALGGACGRIGGDDFAAFYPLHAKSAGKIRRLPARMSAPPWLNNPLSFSVGYYTTVDCSLSASAMYDRACLALETIKGRYDVHVAAYDESMRDSFLEEQKIVNETADALKQGQFEIWLQPQFNHDTGALIGAEALSRWLHPERGLVLPGKFIPIFERNGFIYALDRYTWEKACALLRKWLDQGQSPLPISVNVSRYDIFHRDFYKTIVGLVEKYRIPVELLRLEITESAFVHSPEHIINIMDRLRKYGFFIEIDDFGSGYSSLNTLKDAPADMLKLDMRFLESTSNAERSGNIVESVVRMAKWIGMDVVAEGVETKAQADYLKSIGCPYIQGYLYAKPMPVGEYEELVRRNVGEHQMAVLETVKGLDNCAFWNPESMETLIFNSYVGGACIFEYFNDKLELLRANDKLAQMFGDASYTTGNILKLRFADYVDGDTALKVRENIRIADETDDETSFEMWMRGLPGDVGDICLHATLRIIARTGERRLVYCMVDNITAEKIAEAKSLEASKKLQQLMKKTERDHAALLALMNDTPGGFARMKINDDGTASPLFYNDGFCRLVGMTREEASGLYSDHAYAGIFPEDAETINNAVRAAIKNREVLVINARFLNGSGEYVPLQAFYRVTEDEEGGLYLNGYYSKISEQTEQTLLQMRLLDNLPVGAAVYELAGGKIKCRYINRAYCQLVGRKGKELCVDSVTDAVHPEDLPGLEADIGKGLTDGSGLMSTRIRVRRGGGGYVALQVLGRVVAQQGDNDIVYAVYYPERDEGKK